VALPSFFAKYVRPWDREGRGRQTGAGRQGQAGAGRRRSVVGAAKTGSILQYVLCRNLCAPPNYLPFLNRRVDSYTASGVS
jgi:hypothetical protein